MSLRKYEVEVIELITGGDAISVIEAITPSAAVEELARRVKPLKILAVVRENGDDSKCRVLWVPEAQSAPRLFLWHVGLKASSFHGGYDTFSDFVCIAPDEASALRTWPRKENFDSTQWNEGGGCWLDDWEREALPIVEEGYEKHEWPTIEWLHARKLGEAAEGSEPGVVCASFHAG